ncbi:membrane protein [Rarobacter faecitabidus]|uniref:Secreted protein n=1 Tax=Rarobacter faecitabidus TaxID=13243 RepID=A0A542ZVF7_RARFA|nr:hypothetical protein [Rarobacter faecitabidus]TQL64236.1 hypothetical protein FB461_0730 [Rarobacter faecitabidus]
MAWSETFLIVLGVALLVGLWAARFARRLDRLHRKVLASRMALEAQLLRRANIASRIATAACFDPVTSVLVLAAADEAAATRSNADRALLDAVPDLADALGVRVTRDASGPSNAAVVRGLEQMGIDQQRVDAENGLSLTLREALDDGDEVALLYSDTESAELLEDLAAAWYRSQLARRFHNESVSQVQLARKNLGVRILHLAGHAVMPQPVDLDDTWPRNLKAPDGAVTT